MKNFKKIIALCTLVTLCFTLTGCAFSTFDMTTPLAEQRAQHGIWGADKKTIIYNEQNYLLINYPGMLNFLNTQSIIVTEPDVPLLLREWQGDWLKRSEDDKFIINETGYGNTYYCREDCYEEYEKRFSSPLTSTFYGYEYYDEYWKTYFQKITDDDLALLMNIRNTTAAIDGNGGTAEQVDTPNYYTTDIIHYEQQGYSIVATIYNYSEDLLQRVPILTVFSRGDNLFISYNTSGLYPIPENLINQVRVIISKRL